MAPSGGMEDIPMPSTGKSRIFTKILLNKTPGYKLPVFSSFVCVPSGGNKSATSHLNTLHMWSSMSMVTFCSSFSIRATVSFDSLYLAANSRRGFSALFSFIKAANLRRNCLICETLSYTLSHMRDTPEITESGQLSWCV